MFIGGKHVTRIAVSLIAAASFLGGCASDSGPDRTKSVVTSIDEVEKEIGELKTRSQATLDALAQIQATASTDPVPAFNNFSKGVDSVEEQAGTVRSTANSIREKTKEHYAAWEAEMAKITNPDMRQLAADRKAAAVERFDKINANSQKIRDGFNSYLAMLKDLRTMLANDLNAAGIKAVQSPAKKVTEEGAKVHKQFDSIVAKIAELRKAMASSNPPPPAPKDE